MLSVQEALDAIVAEVAPRSPCDTALADALGLVLAADVISGVDSPPFDKSLMDGYAVRAVDVVDGAARLTVVAELTAGRPGDRSVGAGEAIRIMTGAPIPDGADAVVRIEDTRFVASDSRVTIQGRPITAGTNIVRKGTSLRAGERLLPAGRELRPQELAALAEIGSPRARVYPRPSLAVLATGDELVAVNEEPGPGQIRNSNETMLVAQAVRRGCVPQPLGIARDNTQDLERLVRIGLGGDILCLSGGVSAGKLDLVPAVLRSCGVRDVFHKVAMKPGKPVWFGVLDAAQAPDGRSHYVFGLPGNPVSSMVCFELFVRTAIARLAGRKPAVPSPVRARMAGEHTHRDERATYFPSRIEWTREGPRVAPVRWQGSSDLRSTVEANAMTLFPAGSTTYAPGDEVDVYPW